MPRRLIGRLSHGYRRRVALAQALVGRPGLLLLDEPTTAMDPVQIRAFHDTLRGLAERSAVVLSSHNLYHVEEVCGSVAILEGGRLFAHGTVREVRSQLAGRERKVVVRVRGDERAAAELCRRAGVKVTSELRPDGVVQLGLSGTTDSVDPAEVVRRLVGAGLDVIGVEEVEAALESVYLSSITDLKG
jgi:ABC-2 type transport system ATP-binding protein